MIPNAVQNNNLHAEALLTLQATLLSYDSFEEAATALACELALKLTLERVSIGIIEHAQTQVKAISHTADIQAKHETQRKIARAMDEAIQQAAVIIYPEAVSSQPRVMLAHVALARGSNVQIYTIPLSNNGRIFGALTLERSGVALLKKDEIENVEHIASLLGPVVFLKWQQDRPWHARFKQDWSAWSNRHFASAGLAIKLGFYALLIGLGALLLIPMQYNLSAPARLEGSIQRALVASDNGYLQLAHVRPGDKVKAGQVLAELADEELQLEKRRWQSELAQHENAYGAALAQSDRAQMVVIQSKTEEATSRLALADEKLQHSRILAPFDGVIIKGDLRQSLGAPVQRGDVLLIIAPVDSFRLIIEVDERDISGVKPKQLGRVALESLPDKPLSFNVQRITPVASTKEGRNFFEVEGALTDADPGVLRPGLEGVAKISAGKHTLIWILTHRITDWAKLTLWSWGL